MLDRIREFVKNNKMIDPHDTIVVGISGGADSVCLLIILKELQKYVDFSIIAVHVNHCIRGDEADEDQEFARIICERYGVEFRAFLVEVEKMASMEKISVEEAGRKARYRIFNEVLENAKNEADRNEAKQNEEEQNEADGNEAVRTKAFRSESESAFQKKAQDGQRDVHFRGRIAVAHHMDDQGETILMNILRGSGMKGICGMKPVRDNIIRPLLCVRRHEIEGFLNSKHQPYRTDSTNLDNDYTRNRLRNMVFPYFEKNVNAHSVENICGMAEMVSEAENYIERMAEESASRCTVLTEDRKYVISLDAFSENDIIIKKYIIRKIIGDLAGHLKDVYRVHIESVIELENKQVGSQSDLAYGIAAKRGYKDITLWDKKADRYIYTYKKNGMADHTAYDTKDHISKNAKGDTSGIASENTSGNTKEDILGHADDQIIAVIDDEVYSSDSSDEECIKGTISVEGDYYFKDKGFVHLSRAEFAKVSKSQKIIGNDYTKVFDYDKIKFTLQFRTRKTGDYIQIDENGGNKKLKDFFIDQKVPRDYRDSVLLLADGSHILWIVGYRMSEGYKITSETKCVLQMNLF